MMRSLIFFLSLLSFSICAKEIKGVVKYQGLEEAKKGESQLIFIVESTKAGLFSSDVDGYVKEFSYSANYDEKNQILTDMKIIIKAESMDTDNESRDEKLHNLCLSVKDYPSIVVNVAGPLFLKDARPRKYQGVALIRGKEKIFEIEMNQRFENQRITISGEATWGLKAMEIPDPSIMIAKLSDEIRIKFKINI